MQYFVWKEVDSRDMGVLVQELPPIAKPPKRYEMIEIEGRDGAILEEQGYGAYEKTIKIGITDTSRMDDIIVWLDGSGRLSLSNEPDKYYQCTIFGEINYERLVRFRVAEIPFLAQPFKYKQAEDWTTGETVKNEGNITSRPVVELYGQGTTTVLVNDREVCRIAVDGYVTLDAESQEAKKGELNKNRSMTGKFPLLQPGANTIQTQGGTITEIRTLARSRWL